LPYRPGEDREERLASAVELATWAITGEGLHLQHRVRVAKQAVWFATECDGKLTPRMRTRAAMEYNGPNHTSALQHEHVIPLRVLVERMQACPGDVEVIVREAPAYLVTREEHQRLTPLDRTHQGWDRYRAAGIEVIDALTGAVFLPSAGNRAAPVSGPRADTRNVSSEPIRPRPGSARPGGGTYGQFWALLRPIIDREHPDWLAGASQRNSQHFRGPIAHTRFQFDFATQGLRHQLLFNSSSRAENERRLMLFASVEDELAEAYGDQLRFEDLQGRTQCRVADYLPGATVEDMTRWEEYRDWLVSSGVRLRHALGSVDHVVDRPIWSGRRWGSRDLPQ
jgi:hypothetical protein